MSSTIATVRLVLIGCLLVPAVGAKIEGDESTSRRYKFLYYGPMVNGSHYSNMRASAKVLVQRGHKVVYLMSESGSTGETTDSEFFSFVVFNSSYSRQNRIDMYRDLTNAVMKRPMVHFFDPLIVGIEGNLTGEFSLFGSYAYECDYLLGDSVTMKRLRAERFDMVVGDAFDHCTPLISQALDVPFVSFSSFFAVPTKHGHISGLPIDPSYMPERLLGFTDRMTFLQRVQNYLAYHYDDFIFSLSFHDYDKLKIKHNIRPELSTYESKKQASLFLFLGSFGLEFARPMQPNTVYVLHSAGLGSNQTIEADVADFLDTAPNGVVLFSLGTYVYFRERERAQLFVDGFAKLPHRVLWQAKRDLPSGVELSKNIKIVKWLPLPTIMEHPNVMVYVSQGGAPSTYEAMWAGLPIVGIPFFEDQADNILRVVDRGAGLSLDFASLTSDILAETVSKVITGPKFQSNARRVSLILRDLQTSSPPLETAAHWILHVTKFGGEHLRPAVQDLNYIQRNLLDVYVFLFAILAVILGANAYLCFCCCKYLFAKKSHPKME
ncbi:UDP-glucuronosyltransferase 2B31-like [Patiria miniata]|uniref:UDP-glucuronosyltransferase n=1 Tax=Patiria miniata TaxID=46514 RepID=A0A913Z7V6_PATMI|nr:UDP-glucuronosyltransferase 2B31-like [Patiria miniata]